MTPGRGGFVGGHGISLGFMAVIVTKEVGWCCAIIGV